MQHHADPPFPASAEEGHPTHLGTMLVDGRTLAVKATHSAVAGMLGLSGADLVGIKVTELLPERCHDSLSRGAVSGRSETFSSLALPARPEAPVRLSVHPVPGSGAGGRMDLLIALEQWPEAGRPPEDARRAISELEQRYRLVGDLIPYGVWVMRPKGQLVYVSDSFLQLIGKTAEQACREGWLDRVDPAHVDEVRSTWIDHLRAGTAWSSEYRLIGPDGQSHDILSRGVPVKDDEGSIRSWVGLNLDISDRRESELALRKAKEEAEAANQAKDRFLAILSHELRTPLTPLLTAAQLLEQDPIVPPELRRTVATILRNTELEARLIDDLLDISRIAQGKLSVHPDLVDLHGLLLSVVDMIRRDLSAKHLSLELDLRAEEVVVEADGARLQQVLWNLLKNAIKFTPHSGTIAVRTANAGPVLVLEVEDDGEGIPQDQIGHVFEAFHQAHRTDAIQVGGLGLGLAITRALVELHGGTIEAESDGAGLGSRFRVKLEVAEEYEDPRQTGEWRPMRTTTTHDGGPKRILLVDDHEDTLLLLSMALERHGYDVITATSVSSALETARVQSFDVLVSDIGLPDGTGMDLMARLSAPGPWVPGIALTGFGAEEDVERSRQAGFQEHLTKPVGVRQLLQALGRLG